MILFQLTKKRKIVRQSEKLYKLPNLYPHVSIVEASPYRDPLY